MRMKIKTQLLVTPFDPKTGREDITKGQKYNCQVVIPLDIDYKNDSMLHPIVGNVPKNFEYALKVFTESLSDFIVEDEIMKAWCDEDKQIRRSNFAHKLLIKLKNL